MILRYDHPHHLGVGHMRTSLFSLVVLLVSLVAGPVNADAFSNLMQLADQGDADAQYKLGVMYGDGLGVKQNSAEAVRWYRKAADQGHVDAQLNLGAAYSFGFGVKGNSAEAVRWYRKAADQGHADAQLNLCLMYARGHNVRQNNVTAYMLCSLAASPPTSRASDEAQQLLKILTSNMTPAQITEAQKLAQEWKPTQPEQK